MKSKIDRKALESYSHLARRFVISNLNIYRVSEDILSEPDKSLLRDSDFVLIKSIDDIDTTDIPDSLFFLLFECDDEYLYHMTEIFRNNGRLLIEKKFSKNHYYQRANSLCKKAIEKSLAKNDQTGMRPLHVQGNICQAIEQTRHLIGDYVEIGVYRGNSALLALNYMEESGIRRKSYFLDTFDGFNYKEASDSVETHWKKDNNSHILWGVESTRRKVEALLCESCPNQRIEVLATNICKDDLPLSIKRISVANIDVDIYDATKSALEKVAPMVVKGGIIICEDATSTPSLIGAFYAMEQFLSSSEGKGFMKLHLFGQYFLVKIY